MKATQARAFAVTPPSLHAWWIMALFLLVPAVAVVAIVFADGNAAHPQASIGASVALFVIAMASIGCAIGLKRRRVQLDGQALQVVAGLFSYRVAVDGIDTERARVVDLDERTELRPAIKTFGMSLPGYHAGHFRLRQKLGKAFCLVTDRRRVLWLPLRDGKQQLLLSLEHPQALLDVLRGR
jgi:hypothetical protein